MKLYDFKKIESKWQKAWEKAKLYIAKDFSKKPKFYALIEFPYPSGEGLHVGHIRSNTAMDIIARKRRMEGYNVLYPIGWDAFGLPTENYAIRTGIPPAKATKKNTDTFRRQLKSLGFSFDWSREINTTDPAYYKWTQWMFLQFFKSGLAYKANVPINWCPKDKIGLANEEAAGGICDRCGTRVEKRNKEQWMIKITAYAEKLLEGLEGLDFLPEIKTQQRNWIGRSEGAEIDFSIAHSANKVTVFTTRPETIFGATYLVLAPEHQAIEKLAGGVRNMKEVRGYIKTALKKTEEERGDDKQKIGIELKGVKAINPATKEEIPVWIADYVLSGYGTGAIMAVPAHDERDAAFAQEYRIPIKNVIEPFYIQTTEPGSYREGEPILPRDGIIAIVKHWSENKYIGLQWKKVAWHTFITGGIEKGQDAKQAGIAEIREETGYLNPKFIRDFGVVHGLFYHVPKKENRLVHAHVVYFELQDDTREKISETEAEIHEIQWLTAKELVSFLTPATHLHALQWFDGGTKSYTSTGPLMNSGKFNGMDSEKAKWDIVKFVGGEKKVRYKLRDWVFSRQRYWGEPIPLINCEKCGWVPVSEKDLPVKLPKVQNYKPRDDGASPLASVESWVNVKCPKCKGKAKRETDVMPNWAGSSWYFLRYIDTKNKKTFADVKKLKYWMPIDWYNGGMEHVTLHLLYSRFWNRFLYDKGFVPVAEPYKKRTAHGLILAAGGMKMSKSKGNVINPEAVTKVVGADALRMYEMFMGPFDQAIAWDDKGIQGIERFLKKVWHIAQEKKFVSRDEDAELLRALHKTVKKVSADIETMAFNTAISTLMIFTNECAKRETIARDVWETFLKLLAPFAPHITEELWEKREERREKKGKRFIHEQPWPTYDPKLVKDAMITLVIQVNGKTRDIVQVPTGLSSKKMEEIARAQKKINALIDGTIAKKIITVPDRLINFVL